MDKIGKAILDDLKSVYPADTTGAGHINETPFVLFRFTCEPYKFGYRGTIQYGFIEESEEKIKTMLQTIKNRLNYKKFDNYLIKKVDYIIPQAIEWTDKRWFQEITATIIYEEV